MSDKKFCDYKEHCKDCEYSKVCYKEKGFNPYKENDKKSGKK